MREYVGGMILLPTLSLMPTGKPEHRGKSGLSISGFTTYADALLSRDSRPAVAATTVIASAGDSLLGLGCTHELLSPQNSRESLGCRGGSRRLF